MAKYFSLVLALLFSMTLQAELARDPTTPLSVSFGGVSDEYIELQAVFKSNGDISAIVNGQTVKKGEKVNGWTVANIQDYSVTLFKDGKTRHKALRRSILR